VDQRPRFHRYVVEEHRPSYRYEGDVRIGAVLPEAGVTYYEVPPEYGVREYRYTIVNDRPVLVEPRTHRIVEVIEYPARSQTSLVKAQIERLFLSCEFVTR
jgi:hypothetical protein